MNDQFAELGFKMEDFKPARLVNDPFPLMLVLQYTTRDFKSALSMPNDKIEFSAYVMKPKDLSQARIDRLHAQYIRDYAGGRGEVVLSMKTYVSFNIPIPAKQAMISDLLNILEQSKFIGKGESERKMISDRSGQIERQLNEMGFDGTHLVKSATHTMGDHFALFPGDQPTPNNSLLPNQFINYVISIDDNIITEKAGVVGIKASLREHSDHNYLGTELAELFFYKTNLPHRDEISRQLRDKVKNDQLKVTLANQQNNGGQGQSIKHKR